MPLDPVQIVVLLVAFVVGSGLIERDLWPYIFFYVVAPLLSGLIGAKLLETIPSLGMNFGLDRYMNYLLAKQEEILKAAAIGFACGFAGRKLFNLLAAPSKKARGSIRRPSLFDDSVSMLRRRHLKVLGLTNSAGPRDMFVAWTRLSSELQGPKWQALLKQRGLDCTEEEFKEWVDEAYDWLRANSDEPKPAAKKKMAKSNAQGRKLKEKMQSVQSSKQPKMQIRGI